MKKRYTFLLLLIASPSFLLGTFILNSNSASDNPTILAAQIGILKYDNATNSSDTSMLKLEDIILYTDENGVMYFDTSVIMKLPHFTIDSIFEYYGYLFDFGNNNSPIFRRKRSTNNNYFGKRTTAIYDLLHKGIKLEFGGADFELRNDIPYSLGIYPSDINIDTANIIPKNKVISEFLKSDTTFKNIYKGFPPTVELVIKKIENIYTLIYKLKIYECCPFESFTVHLDPRNLAIITKY